MFFQTSIIAFGFLQAVHAQNTVTVKINTGECPASYSSTATSSSATAAPTGFDRTPCPVSYGSDYIDNNGVDYQVFCNTEIVGNDLPAVNATSLADCFGQCDAYVPALNGPSCVAVSYVAEAVSGGNCELKYDVTSITYGTAIALKHRRRAALFSTSPVDSAKRADFQVSPAIASSLGLNAATSTASSSSATSTDSGSGSITGTSTASSSSATSTDSGSGSASSTSTGSSTGSSSSSGSISATSTDSSTASSSTSSTDNGSGSITATSTDSSSGSMTATSSSASSTASNGPCGCPASNGTTIYDSLNFDWTVLCGESFQGLNQDGAILATDLDDCMVACDNYNGTAGGCVSADYQPLAVVNGNNCFLSTDSAAATVTTPDTCLVVIPPQGKKRMEV